MQRKQSTARTESATRRSLVRLSLALVAAVLSSARHTAHSFVPTTTTTATARTQFAAPRLASSSLLNAKKQAQKAKGFGKPKVETSTESSSSSSSPSPSNLKPSDDATKTTVSSGAPSQPEPESAKPFLQSVDDNAADPEERAKALLREKYGMKSLAEQQLDAKQLQARKEQQQKLSEWKAKAERGEDFDIMSVLPAPVLIAIDRFLKFGTAICTLLFVSAGVLITVEAGSKALDSPLPENLDNFIVTTVEPNFTPGLLVLLGFSVSLGIFAALQLGSQGSTYKED